MRCVQLDFSSRNAQIGLVGQLESAIEEMLRATGRAARYVFVNESTFEQWLLEIEGRTSMLPNHPAPPEPELPELLGDDPRDATWRGYIAGLACWTFPSTRQRKAMVLE